MKSAWSDYRCSTSTKARTVGNLFSDQPCWSWWLLLSLLSWSGVSSAWTSQVEKSIINWWLGLGFTVAGSLHSTAIRRNVYGSRLCWPCAAAARSSCTCSRARTSSWAAESAKLHSETTACSAFLICSYCANAAGARLTSTRISTSISAELRAIQFRCVGRIGRIRCIGCIGCTAWPNSWHTKLQVRKPLTELTMITGQIQYCIWYSLATQRIARSQDQHRDGEDPKHGKDAVVLSEQQLCFRLLASCLNRTKIADCKGQLRGSAAAHKQLATLGNE